MIANEVAINGLVSVEVDGIPHFGVRILRSTAEHLLHTKIPDGVVTVMIHHKRTLRMAVVAINDLEEFHINLDDINPWRQLN